MTGGLLQLITSGRQDIYLTINPEITFFKKAFRRHTNFAMELREIIPEQTPEYDSNITFILNNYGDALHRCYLEIELPILKFSDKYIENSNYFLKKNTDISNLTTQLSKWQELYNNLKGFCDIEIVLYRRLKQYLDTVNILITTLKNEVTNYNYLNKSSKDLYKNKIDGSILTKIDISNYISSINKLITNDSSLSSSTYITRSSIITEIDTRYSYMIEYLDFYNLKINYYKNEITKKNNEYQINFNYAEFLGHNYFEYFNLEIGGNQFERYPNDYLHINQMHYIKPEFIPNYLDMIGHTEDLNKFNSKPKGGRKILVPLIFWFNKDAGSSLPLVSLQYSTVTINIKISDLKKIICFENYEKFYDDISIVDIGYETTNKIVLNTNLIYKDYKINLRGKSIIYNCLYINEELLKNKFPDLTSSERNILLQNIGTSYTKNQITKLIYPDYTDAQIIAKNGPTGSTITEYIINKKQWIYFMMNIKNTLYTDFSYKISDYYYYIDFNMYYSMIENPNIRLIGEFIYFDDVEREKFAESKLEYVIETVNEDIYNIKNQKVYDCELSFSKPCKELIWYIQPQIFKDGITTYGQNTSLLFDTSKYFMNDIISNQNLTFNQLEVLLKNVDKNYYTNLLSYKYLNNNLLEGLYYNSFCLYPEETQPSGTINFREIKGKQYKIDLTQSFLDEYFISSFNPNNKNLLLKFFAKSYDLFIIHKGQAKLMFNM